MIVTLIIGIEVIIVVGIVVNMVVSIIVDIIVRIVVVMIILIKNWKSKNKFFAYIYYIKWIYNIKAQKNIFFVYFRDT